MQGRAVRLNVLRPEIGGERLECCWHGCLRGPRTLFGRSGLAVRFIQPILWNSPQGSAADSAFAPTVERRRTSPDSLSGDRPR
jgi:hypothetical protein